MAIDDTQREGKTNRRIIRQGDLLIKTIAESVAA
jgi:hypothetical protein